MHIHLKNTPAKFYPDLIWNDGALRYFWRGRHDKNKTKRNKKSSNMRLVSDLKIKDSETK